MVKYVLEYKEPENPDTWKVAKEYLSSEFVDAKDDCIQYMSLPSIVAARIVCVTIEVARTEFGRCEKDYLGHIVKSGLCDIGN